MKRPFFNFKLKKIVRSLLTESQAHLNFNATKGSPDELLGELFQDVQLRRIYPDSITFVDLVPANKMRRIFKLYNRQRQSHNFDLHTFVRHHFRDYLTSPDNYKTNPNHTIEQHINELWNVLTHENYTDRGSLLALPYPYIVPGGRYLTAFYWDSYFIMLGLAASKRYDLLQAMMRNLVYMVRKFGYIPNGNRSYYIGRSQPPFLVYCARLMAAQKQAPLTKYLPSILSEYKFWMNGHKQLHRLAPAYRRVVMVPDGRLLNRYYDNKRTPRPEGYKEDVEIAHEAFGRTPSQVYLDLRAAAESGWDFSSRWLGDGKEMSTVHTTDLLPVDLNCLLVELERTIAEAYQQRGRQTLAKLYREKAKNRTEAIRTYCWSKKDKFFMDYDFVAGKTTTCFSLAGAFPLFARVATKEEAASVAKILKERFLQKGGLLTTLHDTGQQWDAPNGWAPLEWIAIQGLRNYGYNELADTIKQRWIDANVTVYKAEGKLVEKYNMREPHNPAGGGEYALQDGFGMTNGVLMALLHEGEMNTMEL